MTIPDYTFDKARLEALDLYKILDTAAEPGFDDIASLAAHVCDAPIALVSLVAGDRQWFKAKVGIEACETSLNRSVCAYALVEKNILVIPDLTADPRTRDNPLVKEDPRLRFYAGAPLRTAEGHTLGSLCVIDLEPRPAGLTENQATMLEALARQVVSQLDLRRLLLEHETAISRQAVLEKDRDHKERSFRNLFDLIDDGFCIIEMKFEAGKPVDYRFVEVNAAFARQTGLMDAPGRWMRDLAPEHEQHWYDLYGQVATTGQPVHFERPAKELGDRWYEVQAFPVGDATANRVGVLFRDASARKSEEVVRQSTEALQGTLNQELNHRMKNIFAMVQAIASQSLRAADNQGLIDAFTKRLHALSTAHDVLLQHRWSGAEIGQLASAVLKALAPLERFDIDGPAIRLGPQMTLSTTLVLHELCANALKYGALSNNTGRVALNWSVTTDAGDEMLVVQWRETGGPPPEPNDRNGFGSKLTKRGLTGTGGAELRFLKSGFEAKFIAPLAQVQGT